VAKEKFCFAKCVRGDKISPCGNIMICSGLYSTTAGHAKIAPALERYQSSARKLGLI
jgi:hypothetical protein